MTRVDFYILADQAQDACMRFACRLSLKAWQAGHCVHVHVDEPTIARAMDELLWDYPKHRFIPHEVAQSADAATSSPVHIGWDEPQHTEGLLINLSAGVPTFFGRFDRVAEVVVGDTREQGRARYKHYRDRGYPLYHHELDDWEQAS